MLFISNTDLVLRAGRILNVFRSWFRLRGWFGKQVHFVFREKKLPEPEAAKPTSPVTPDIQARLPCRCSHLRELKNPAKDNSEFGSARCLARQYDHISFMNT